MARDLMNTVLRDAILAWLAEQFQIATPQGGNTISIAGNEVTVETADVVDDAVLVLLSDGESFAIELKEV